MEFIINKFKPKNPQNLNFFINKKYIYYNELVNKNGNRYNNIKENLDEYDTYSCSPNTIFDVLSNLNITNNDSILDIGAGRGFVMVLSYLLPFKLIGGVEISKSDVDIMKNNFGELELDLEKIKIYDYDILKFDEYYKYNYFYFYNPFGEEIFEEIIKNIKLNSKNPKIIYLNIHDNHEKKLIENNFILEKSYIDETLLRKCNVYKYN